MWRRVIAHALPLSMIAALAVLLVFALVTLATIERDMRVEASENMLWVLSQAQRASLRFDAAVARSVDGVEQADLGLRFNVFLSRLDILSDGPQARYLDSLDLGMPFEAFTRQIPALEQFVIDAQGGDRSAAARIHEVLSPLNTYLGHAANAAMVAQWDELGSRLDEYRKAVWQIIGSIVGIMVIGAFLSVRLLYALREGRRTVELERSLENERSASEFYRSFASMVSHQFRTPLAVIDSSMQRLVRRGDRVSQAEIGERANKVRAAIKRLTRLVEGTLDAARIDSGQVDMITDTHNLGDLVRAVCARWRENARQRKIDVVYDETLESAAALARCDPALVEHIISNLISNADKYSPSDSIIEVRVGMAEQTAFCSVRDHGAGIPSAELPHLFERFYRASTASGTTGTGIGLNLARNLARLQGGDVTVESVSNEGSIFTLHLPRANRGLLSAAE